MKKRLLRLIAYAVARIYLRKPDLAELISFKFNTFSTIYKAAINELCYLFRLARSYKVISANIELTNDCNLSCAMCPVGNKTMKRKTSYMREELFKKVIDQNPTLDFILIFQWGESLLHKNLAEYIRYAVRRGIRVFLTTNGTLLNVETDRRLIETGLERVTFSVDGREETYESIRGFSYQQLRRNIEELKKVRDEMKSPLQIDISMVMYEKTETDIAAFKSEWQGIADRLQLIPRFTQTTRRTPCRELWRGTLTVLADGTVVPCCADYDAECSVGDISRQALAEIWNGEKIQRLRKAHGKKKFYGICSTCGEYENAAASKRFD